MSATLVEPDIEEMAVEHGNRYAHYELVRGGKHAGVAVCGFPRSLHSGHGWAVFGKLCNCGAPVCPSCLAVHRIWKATGIWEGID